MGYSVAIELEKTKSEMKVDVCSNQAVYDTLRRNGVAESTLKKAGMSAATMYRIGQGASFHQLLQEPSEEELLPWLAVNSKKWRCARVLHI